ncbi:MAG: hypothetical protein ACKVTZ_09630 [Bacteroidia bacterium]
MANFSTWTLSKLKKRFELKPTLILNKVEEWQCLQEEITDFDKHFLAKMQAHLQDNGFSWNEAELAQHFIGPLFSWVNFSSENSNIFHERSFVAKVDGEELMGEPDAIIAFGHDEPEIPYFCLQEYKKELNPSGDAVGQCLAAMLAAQEINEYKHPIYGIYVVGQNWYFLALKNRQYHISPSFSAASDEIYEIYCRLLWLKQTILGWIEASK